MENTNDADLALSNDNVISSDDETNVDVWLFKIVGLYHLLWPVGEFGERCRTALMVVSAIIAVVYAVQIGVLYLAIDDFPRLAYMVLLITTSYTCVFKAYVLVRHADQLWSILELACYKFTTSGRRDPSELLSCRDALSMVLRSFVAFNYCTLICWLMTPLLFHEPVRVTNIDGKVAMYHTTVFNLWTPLPEQVYNSPIVHTIIYVFECFICSYNLILWTMFDCYVMTVCYLLNANFRTMTTGYQTLGRFPVTDIIRDQDTHSKTNRFNDLMGLIKDNQKIIKKYDEYFNVIQPVVLVQIAAGSVSVILLIFFTSLTYATGWPFLSMPVLKFFSGFLAMAMQLFFYCHAFTYIETAKSSVNFGLYSSNWTDKDMKFKKTLLLAMKMNSCHQRVMKLSPISIINVEMFARVMNMSYSIVQLLVNTSVAQTVEK